MVPGIIPSHLEIVSLWPNLHCKCTAYVLRFHLLLSLACKFLHRVYSLAKLTYWMMHYSDTTNLKFTSASAQY